MRPITIAGAGLAGLALSNALQDAGVPTTLYEAHTLPRHRVCGEFICGRGAAALATLGLADSLAGAKQHRSIQWSRLGKTVFHSTLPDPAIGLSRYLLDIRLADRFRAAGGTLLEDNRYPTETAQPGEILCHGRSATTSDWIGLKFHSLQLQTAADLELHLGQHGYLGISAIEGERYNVCALFKRRPEIKAHKTKLLLSYLSACGLHGLAEQLSQSEIDPESHVGVAGISFAQTPPQNDKIARLGDAYSVIPPFTGNGMSIALESAAIAFPEVHAYALDQQSWSTTVEHIQQQLHKNFHHRLRYAQALHPWIHYPLRQGILTIIARLHLLPFHSLYKLTH